jgi:hypothetical protein
MGCRSRSPVVVSTVVGRGQPVLEIVVARPAAVVAPLLRCESIARLRTMPMIQPPTLP